MPRASKPNEVPVYSGNLRTRGPVKEADLLKELGGKKPRIAMGRAPDSRATIDKDPCPDCGNVVEWAATTRKENGKSVRYVYARCRGAAQHRFAATPLPSDSTQAITPDERTTVHPASLPDRPKPVPPTIPDSIPAPRPSAAATLMQNWIDNELHALGERIEKLKQIQLLTKEVVVPTTRPLASPQLPTPHNGDPTPPHIG